MVMGIEEAEERESLTATSSKTAAASRPPPRVPQATGHLQPAFAYAAVCLCARRPPPSKPCTAPDPDLIRIPRERADGCGFEQEHRRRQVERENGRGGDCGGRERADREGEGGVGEHEREGDGVRVRGLREGHSVKFPSGGVFVNTIAHRIFPSLCSNKHQLEGLNGKYMNVVTVGIGRAGFC